MSAHGNASPIRSWAQVARVSALAVCVLGGLAFAGWVLGFERLTAFQAGRIPMAPSTAVLLILFGVLMFWDVVAEDLTPARFWSRLAASVFGIGVALVLLILSSLGITPGAEHLWLEPSGKVSGAPVGHMSPVTAFGFVVAGAAYVLLALPRAYRRPRAAFVLGIVLELLGLTLTTAYILSRPLLYDTGFIPPALSTSLAFMALGGAVLGAAAPRVWAGDHADEIQPKPVYPMLAVLALTAALIVTPAYLLFQEHATDFRAQVEAHLLSVADLKAGQVEAWRGERLSDATTFHENTLFAELVEAALYQDDREAVEQIRSWLKPVVEAYGYPRIAVMDSTGRARITVPDTGPPSSDAEYPAADAIRAGDITLLEFHRDEPEGPVHLTALAPVLGPDGGALGAVALRADPASYLYPALAQWPVASRTAEILLVRRDGDAILVLNDLRFRDDAALNLRLPASDEGLLAARAVRGDRGVIAGRDYWGEPSIGAVRQVPGTVWWLVVRMDTEEAFGPLRSRLAWTVALVIFLVLAAIGLLGFGWERRNKLHYRELARGEQRYHTLLQSIGDAVIATDRTGRVEVMNPVAETLTGWTLEDAVGRPLDDVFVIVNEETREPVESPVAKVLRKGRVVGLANSTQLIARDGTERPIADSGAPIRDESGAIGGVVLVFRDQTRDRQARQELREREEQYRSLFEGAPVGIFRTNSDGQAVAVNGTMARILGFESADQAVEHYHDLAAQLHVRPERRAEVLRQLRENGFLENFQYEARRLDGTIIWIEMNARALDENPDGTFDIEGFAWEITDKKEAEQTRRQRQTMLERTERIAGIGSWEWDVDTGTVTWSDEMFRIFRRDPDLGTPSLPEHAEFLSPAEMDRLETVVEQAVNEGQSYDIELQVQGSGETVWHIQSRGFPETAPDGRVRHLHGLVEDVTERNRRLEREAALGAQLSQAQKMESIGRLAGGVAHDFNNMLSVILGHVELAQESLDPEHVLHGDLGQIQQAAENSAQLTRQLLAFAREQVANPEVLELNETISGTLGMLRRLIHEEVELRWRPADAVWPVKVDPVQVNQVLTNLVVNSRDAIDGVGRVTIETRNVAVDESYAELHADAVPGDYVVLAVADTGSGMNAEILRQIFDPFFTTKRLGQGTGLGLATVYGIVRQNHGFITVYSEPGQGTTLNVHIPRFKGATSPANRPGERIDPATGSETVLVVEDQPAVLGVVRKILERLGYTVLSALTPGHAMELARENGSAIHLLITDVVMPEMNGRELAERLAAEHPDIPVLFMSGYAEDVIAERGVIEAGMHFVEKPFTAAVFAAKVRQALAQRVEA